MFRDWIYINYSCLGIGQKMAMMEARLLVAFIARNYDLEPIPGQDLDPITTITTGLKNGLMMKAKKRKM